MPKYYEPKCKVCNSSYRELYERLRQQGWELQQIVEYSDKLNDGISVYSLSRHLSKHTKTFEIPKIELPPPNEEILDEKGMELFNWLICGMDTNQLDRCDKALDNKAVTEPLFYTERTCYSFIKQLASTECPEYLDELSKRIEFYKKNKDRILNNKDRIYETIPLK